MTKLDARNRLIIALDVPDVEDAHKLVKQIGDAADFYKIGLELLYAGGIELARKLIGEGKQIFIDAKLHDIPNTVERATRQLAQIGASLLTVHAYPQTMKAAYEGRGDASLRIIGVTILTSMSEADAKAAGYSKPIAEIVALRAQAAHDSGIDGIVCAPHEAAEARKILGKEVLVVTPGIRPSGGDAGDQSRIATPLAAIRNGASHLVVGRPVTRDKDPRAAALAIAQEIAQGLEA